MKFSIGDLVKVNGVHHKGIGQVIAAAYPMGSDVTNIDADYPGWDKSMGFKLNEPFPQVRVAILDDIAKPGRIIRYHGNDLADGKVQMLTKKVTDCDFSCDFELDAICKNWHRFRKSSTNDRQ